MQAMDIFAKLSVDTSDISTAIGALGNLASAVGSFAADSVRVGEQFDAAMSSVAAISGATGGDLDALRDKAQEMGASTKFSATEAADAMGYMAMAGWKTEDMLGGIEGIMSLAAASGEDLATTSDIVTDALTAFGLTAADSGHFADILAAASSNANTNVAMMGETFKYAAPVAGALGFSAEDTAEAIGLMANAGIKASQAGTSLRTIMSQMKGPIDLSGEALGNVSIMTTNADGSMRDLSDILGDCREAFNKMTPAEKAFNAENIAGKNAMSGFLALMNAAPGDVEKLSTAIDECGGAARSMAEIMQDNLAGDLTIFESALEGAQIVLSDQLTPTLRDFVQFGTEGLTALTEGFETGGVSGAMEALGGILSDGVSMVVDMLPEMTSAGTELILGLTEGIIGQLPGIGDAAVQIVTGLATSLGGALPELIPAATQMVAQLVTTLTDPGTLSGLSDSAIALLQGLAEGIINSIPILIETAPQIVENIVTGIAENVPKLTENGVSIITQLVQAITDNLPTLLEQAPAMIEQLLGALLEAAPLLIDAAIEWVTVLSQGIVDNLPKIIEAVPKIITAIVTTLAEHLPEILTKGGELVLELVNGILDGIPKVAGAVGKVVKEVVDGFKDLPKKALEWGKDLIKNFMDGISSKAKALGDKVAGIANDIKGFLGFSEPEKGPLSDFHTYAPDMMNLFAEGVRDNAGMLQREIERAFDVGDDIVYSGPKAGPWGGAGAAQQIIVPRGGGEMCIGESTLELDRVAFGRLIFKLYNEEAARVGVKLVQGVV